MMVEMARLLQTERLVQLKRIARITGLSANYLGQLAISLRDNGLLIGVSGKKGGYKLARPAREITIREIVRAVQGPIFATECVAHSDLCLNAEFCETRTIWALVSHKVQEVLDEYTLADVIEHSWMAEVEKKHPDIPYLNVNRMVYSSDAVAHTGCPSDHTEEPTS
jgi:Rrf2 family cysteine metabolism transcriptional repressor